MKKRDVTREYRRDGRAPIPKEPRTSYTMSRIRGKNTKPEMTLRRALWKCGLRGYRLHRKELPGRPDIVFISKRVAIFVNGCFWHRCPFCKPSMPKTNIEFWSTKFSRNVERDRGNIAELETLGWNVVTIWACQIEEDLNKCIKRIREGFQ